MTLKRFYLNWMRVLLFYCCRTAEPGFYMDNIALDEKHRHIVWVISFHLSTSALSPGFRQYGRLPSQLIRPIHLITPVYTAAHHSCQPQGLNFLHGAGERDRPLAPPLPCPAQVASAPLSAHLNHLLLLPSHVPSDQV